MADERQESHRYQTVDTITHVINAILAAGVIGLGSMVVSNNTELAATKTRSESIEMRLESVRDNIGDRYRRSDAEDHHKEMKKELRYEREKIESWVERINEKVDRLDRQIYLLPRLENEVQELEKQIRDHETKKGHK